MDSGSRTRESGKVIFARSARLARLPQPDGPLMAAGGQGLAVWRKSDGIDALNVATEDQDHLTGDRVNKPDLGIAAGGGERAAVRRERKPPDGRV
jgi:hypothetical protein